MAEDNMNPWDGYDGTDHVYDEKKEKRYQSRIWLVAGGVLLCILISMMVKCAGEIRLFVCGRRIEAEYSEQGGRRLAEYRDENGHLRIMDISGYLPARNGNHITLYYMEEEAEAVPFISPVAWAVYYLIFGALFALCIWRVRRIYRPRRARKKSTEDLQIDPVQK